MKEQRVKQLNSFINENIIKRKAMFIPILGVSVFMLVGYAAVDKEAPKIVSNRIEVSYGDKVDLDAIDITDNQDSRPEIEVTANDLSSVNVNQLGTYDLSVTATDSFSNTASKVIKVDVVDDEAPKFKVAGVETGYVVQVPINGSQDISSYVTASDNVDGDVSPFIESNQELDTTKAGIQDIKLSVTDSSGNVNEKTFTFAVSDLTAPVVTLSQGNDIVIDYGSEFKLENFLTATDDQSAVTNTVTGEVDTKKENEVQTITVSTQDEAKNEVLTTLNFTVKDISGPQVNLSTNAVEVIKGDAFDPRQYLVSAIDNKKSTPSNRSIELPNFPNINKTRVITITKGISLDDSIYLGYLYEDNYQVNKAKVFEYRFNGAHPKYTFLNEKEINDYLRRGIDVNTWTVDSDDIKDFLVDEGVKTIITNKDI